MRKLVSVLIALRLAATLTLVFSPAFANTDDLDGWDVARFQAIGDADGQAYVDFEVEYPPGSLLLIRAITTLDHGPDRTVTTHRLLAASSLIVDLALAALLHRRWGLRSSITYLTITTPLIFFGLVRFDLWAALLAAIAAVALAERPAIESNRVTPASMAAEQKVDTPGRPHHSLALDSLAGSAIAAGALIKVWPALLVVGAIVVRRYRAAVIATGVGTAAGLLWLMVSGSAALDQVLSLRGATGWQIESVGGSLTALFTSQEPELQADAFRIGTMDPAFVTISRFFAVATAVGLGLLASRSSSVERFALTILGSVAALLVTAPLLSPQFMLWLAPWAAIAASNGSATHANRCDTSTVPNPSLRRQVERHVRTINIRAVSSPTNVAIAATACALALTSLILSIAGPPNLHHTIPALTLLFRDALLLVVVAASALALHQSRASATNAKAQPEP